MGRLLLPLAAILSTSSFAAELELKGTSSLIKMNQAQLAVSCGDVTPAIRTITPTVMDTAYNTTLTLVLTGVAETCINVPIETPCAAHSARVPALFYCTYTAASGSTPLYVGPLTATAEEVLSASNRYLGTEVMLNCPQPPYDQFVGLTSYPGDGSTVSLSVGAVHFGPPGVAGAVALPFQGPSGGNVVNYTSLPAPPSPSLPPAPVSPPASPPPYFSSITFTHCGVDAAATQQCLSVPGPTQSECDAEYAGTSLDPSGLVPVSVTGGLQRINIQANGFYHIAAMGAKGGDVTHEQGATGGQGATAVGEMLLSVGDVLVVLVGQPGTCDKANSNPSDDCRTAGGGGASFVALERGGNPLEPLVVAGGGGGASGDDSYQDGYPGRQEERGGDGGDGESLGGSSALGGEVGTGACGRGSGGGGWFGPGQNKKVDGTCNPHCGGADDGGGQALNSGALGGQGYYYHGQGGFGGGGGSGNYGGGGGGGYGGGGAGVQNNKGGGGGGSFVTTSHSARQIVKTAGGNSGTHGLVTITTVHG